MYDRKSFTKTLEAVQDYMSLNENTVSAEIDMMHKNKDTTAEQGPGEAKKYLHKIGGPSIKVTKYTHSGPGGGHPSVKFSGHVKHVMKAINTHEDEKYSHDIDGHKEYKKDFGESVENVDENIISRLTGGHGRYMKKLKMAHDHHDTMMKAHSDMEHHIDPSAGSDPDSNRDPDHQYVHGQATQAHYHAREAIKKLAAHAKENKLTSHPKGSEYKDAKESSAEANENSRDAISRDRSTTTMGRGRAPYSGPFKGYASKNYDTHPATIVKQNFVKGHRGEISKTKTDHHKSLD